MKIDNIILQEEQIHCKSAKAIGESFPGEPIVCEICVFIDGKEYKVYAIYQKSQLKKFDEYRSNSQYYASLPSIDEVSIPTKFHDIMRGGFDFNPDSLGRKIRSMAIRNHKYKFFCIPKALFFDYLEELRYYREYDEKLSLYAETFDSARNNEWAETEQSIRLYEECINMFHEIASYHKNNTILQESYICNTVKNAHARLINVYKRLKQTDKIEDVFQSARNIFGNNYDNDIELKTLASEYYKVEVLYPHCREKIELQSEPLASLYISAMTLYYSEYGNDIEFTEGTEEAARLDEISSRYNLYKGKIIEFQKQLSIHLADKNYIEAAKVCEKMIANHLNAYQPLIDIYEKAGEYSIVSEIVDEALEKYDNGEVFFMEENAKPITNMLVSWKKKHALLHNIKEEFPERRLFINKPEKPIKDRFKEAKKTESSVYEYLPQYRIMNADDEYGREYMSIKLQREKEILAAKLKEAEGNYKEAILILENLVSEGFNVYNQLISYYKKADLPEAIKEVAEEALLKLANGLIELPKNQVKTTKARWEKEIVVAEQKIAKRKQ